MPWPRLGLTLNQVTKRLAGDALGHSRQPARSVAITTSQKYCIHIPYKVTEKRLEAKLRCF